MEYPYTFRDNQQTEKTDHGGECGELLKWHGASFRDCGSIGHPGVMMWTEYGQWSDAGGSREQGTEARMGNEGEGQGWVELRDQVSNRQAKYK